MKRKISKLDEDETRLSQLLFNKTKGLAEKLKSQPEFKFEDEARKPAWFDEDDESIEASTMPRYKSNGLYKEKLKQKYEQLIGTPSWAKLDGKPKTEDDDDILRKVGHLEKPKRSLNLPQNFLALNRLPKINEQTKNEGPIIKCVEFHPKVSAALVAGQSGLVSLFSIGGDVNNKLHNFKLKKWRISSAHFTPDGNEAFITSKHNHSYCIYNLVKAEPTLVQLPKVVTKPLIFEMSKDGKYIATATGYNEVYIISVSSRELIRCLTTNSNVQSVSFSPDSKKLYCLGAQGEVSIYDLSTFRVVQKFYDHGCVTASCITASPCGRLLATGSGEGIVNIYETASLTTAEPVPQKCLSHLRTKITNLKFNSTTEILAMSSSFYPNAVKLVHIPSYHVFMNFPKQTSNLYQVEGVSFSPNSGYMSVFNNKGNAFLYRLKYYKNY